MGPKTSRVTVIVRYVRTIGGGSCSRIGAEGNSSSCSFRASGKPRVDVSYFEMNDPISGSLEISVEPPAEGG